MDQGTNQIFFALLRSAIRGEPLPQEVCKDFSEEKWQELMPLAHKHDLTNLVVYALQQNELLPQQQEQKLKKLMLKAVFRCEQLDYEFGRICEVLEDAAIPFIPLKGAVLRRYYREPWMRTSCDIDILLRREDVKSAAKKLEEALQYTLQKQQTRHDISLYSPGGTHIEMHFDLVEEGRANNAFRTLSTAWEHAVPHEDCRYRQDLDDAFFYFYHIAHMAKHFESGGCGVRSFIDLWILDGMADHAAREARDNLLLQGGLLQYAETARRLSRVWFGDGEEPLDDLLRQMQGFVLHGGVYGAVDSRVTMLQHKEGGRFSYIWSRIFMPFDILKTIYPILQRHPWLAPVMHVRRWCRLLNPTIAKRAGREIKVSGHAATTASQTADFLRNVGL